MSGSFKGDITLSEDDSSSYDEDEEEKEESSFEDDSNLEYDPPENINEHNTADNKNDLINVDLKPAAETSTVLYHVNDSKPAAEKTIISDDVDDSETTAEKTKVLDRVDDNQAALVESFENERVVNNIDASDANTRQRTLVIRRTTNAQELTICGITRSYTFVIDSIENSRICIGSTSDDDQPRIPILQYWTAASIVNNFGKTGSFKATFSVLLPVQYAASTFVMENIPNEVDKVILLALWMAPCGQLQCIGYVNNGSLQRLPAYNSWVTAPHIDLSAQLNLMWTKYMFWIDYHGPRYAHDNTTRYVLYM